MNNFKWFLSILFIVLLTTPGYALEVRTGQAVNIAKDEVIDDDLIVFARTVDIKGTVSGDVCAFAQDITISGMVEGSIFSGAAEIDIDAKSVKTIWAAAGEINVSGDVEKNVILAGGQLCVCEGARIGKDIRAYGGIFAMKGDVNGSIEGGAGEFVMAGSSGDVSFSADEVSIKSSAVISGDLCLETEEEPIIEEGASITGETKLEKSEEEDEEVLFALAPMIAFFVSLVKIILFVAKIIVGVVLIAFSKKFVRRIMDTLISKPAQSLGIGFLGIIVIPVAVMILFMVMIGYPFAIFGIYVYTMLFYLSSIFISLVVGEKIIQLFKKEGEISLYLSFIIGIIVLFVLGLIPFLGFIVKLIVLIFGAGMLLLGSWNLLKEIREKKLI